MEQNKSRIEALIRLVYRYWKKGISKPGEPCPSEENLACFVDGLLKGKEARKVKGHLIKCDKCMESVIIAIRISSKHKI